MVVGLRTTTLRDMQRRVAVPASSASRPPVTCDQDQAQCTQPEELLGQSSLSQLPLLLDHEARSQAARSSKAFSRGNPSRAAGPATFPSPARLHSLRWALAHHRPCRLHDIGNEAFASLPGLAYPRPCHRPDPGFRAEVHMARKGPRARQHIPCKKSLGHCHGRGVQARHHGCRNSHRGCTM